MPDTLPDTAEALAQQRVAQYVPRLRGARTPAYRQPALTIEALPACLPAFAETMTALYAQLDLNDRTVCSQDVAHVLRYHRMNGLRQLYKRGVTGVDLLTHDVDHAERCRMLGYDLTVLIGELFLTLLGPDAYARWFPWHNFTVLLEGDRGFRLWCTSLEHHRGADGRPFYASATAPTVSIRGRTRRVAFTPHAITRLAERAVPSRSYASLGDVFGLIDTVHIYEGVTLHPRQDAFALFEHCVPGFFSSRYATEVLGTWDATRSYVYRVGYCPVADETGFFVAKTVLAPGFSGTPEYQALRTTSFDPGVQERLLERAAQQSYAMLCSTRDFGLLRWWHAHGVPQVKRL